jgi:hypothetical protein
MQNWQASTAASFRGHADVVCERANQPPRAGVTVFYVPKRDDVSHLHHSSAWGKAANATPLRRVWCCGGGVLRLMHAFRVSDGSG